jgi:hypothetical protein
MKMLEDKGGVGVVANKKFLRVKQVANWNLGIVLSALKTEDS